METLVKITNEKYSPNPEHLSLPNGGEVVIRRFNKQSVGPTVIYLETMGIAESFDIKMKALRHLSSTWSNKSNFVHVALPGFLDALPPTTISTSTYSEALNVAYDHMEHDKPHIWMGHSTPTAFLLQHALDYPKKFGLLVLSCPPLDYNKTIYRKLTPGIGKFLEEKFDNLPCKIRVSLFKKILCETDEIIAKLTPEQMKNMVTTIAKTVLNSGNHTILNELRVPTMVLQGRNDILTPSLMSQGITNPYVEFLEYKGGHVEIFKKLYDPKIAETILDRWKKTCEAQFTL